MKKYNLVIKNICTKNFLLPLILGTGALLRLYKWNSYSFWLDEAGWLIMHRGKLLLSLKGTIMIFKPPLFRFLVYFWTYIGEDEFRLRLLPFFLGILAILFIYKFGKALFDEKTGLIASLLLSFSPFHIYYSQELTHHILTVILTLCSMYYLFCSLEKDDFYSWIKFVFFTSLCLYTSYIFFFMIIMQNIFFFSSYLRYKKLLKRWLSIQLVILVLYSPWLAMIPAQLSVVSLLSADSRHAYVYWCPKGSLFHIFQALRIFNVGYNADFIVQFFASLLFFPLFLIGAVSHIKNNGQKIRLLIFWIFIPMVLSILFSGIIRTFTYRNFILALPAYYILVAAGITKLKRYRYIPILFFIVLSSLSLANYYRDIFPYPAYFYHSGVPEKIDNRAATQYIVSNFKEGDTVVHTCRQTILTYMYYRYVFGKHDISCFRNFICHLIPVNTMGYYDWESYFLVDKEEKIRKTIETDNKRIWLVFSNWESKKLPLNPFMKENRVKKWFDERFKITDHRKFTGVDVYLYEKPGS